MSRKKPAVPPNRPLKLIGPQIGGSLLARHIGRNDPCRCGSGKKAKLCCGAETQYKSTKPKPKEVKIKHKGIIVNKKIIDP